MSQGEGITAANDNESRKGNEAVEAMKVTVLDKNNIVDYAKEIVKLGHNLLDARLNNQGGDLHQRKSALESVIKAIYASEGSKMVLVTEGSEGNITSVLIVNRSEVATAEQLWADTGDTGAQQVMITNLVKTALDQLGKGHHMKYTQMHMTIDPSIRSEGLKLYLNSFPENQSKLVISGPEDGAKAANDNQLSVDLEKAA